MNINLYNGDCLIEMKHLEDNSVDSIVTDPPYGLSFMGKKWDYDVPKVEIWEEALRVLKPGGYLLAFAGTRTQHRMAVNIEDAGFEIRDMIAWVYGSGFPKSHNISKAIDKNAGVIGKNVENIKKSLKEFYESSNFNSLSEFNESCGFEASGYFRTSSTWGNVLPSLDKWLIIKKKLNIGDEYDSIFTEAEREIIGKNDYSSSLNHSTPTLPHTDRVVLNKTAPSTDEAMQWDGWGTALKPALEPITMARKPLDEKTIASNVLKYGTGGINIDGCRVEYSDNDDNRIGKDYKHNAKAGLENGEHKDNSSGEVQTLHHQQGRFPANFIHDGSDEVTELFPESKVSGSAKSGNKNVNNLDYVKSENLFGGIGDKTGTLHNDSGSASRFFYCAKASKKDRNEGLEEFEDKLGGSLEGGDDKRNGKVMPQLKMTKNNHPTVKPTALMRYLVRLVTPPNGTVLDPFMGSGSTGKACKLEGFNFIGIEMDEDYMEIAEARIKNAKDTQQKDTMDTIDTTEINKIDEWL